MSESKKNISIIYYQRNNSPKYIEINKHKFILFLVGLPTITLIALTLGTMGLIQTSPFHLLENYRQNAKVRVAVQTHQELENKVSLLEEQNKSLEDQILSLQNIPATTSPSSPDGKCPEPVACKPIMNGSPVSSIGLSTLSFFKPINGQKDKTRPASLNLTGFKSVVSRDYINLQFNIINLLGEEIKLIGHIVVLMKSDISIQVYPAQALLASDYQINYSAGEPFATQRFRPVDASFVNPKRPGNYMFTVFIFAKTGDLIHYQNMTLPIR